MPLVLQSACRLYPSKGRRHSLDAKTIAAPTLDACLWLNSDQHPDWISVTYCG